MGFKKKKKQKAASVDFTELQLPHNRRQQFSDCIKVRWALLIQTGAILFLFLLPCFILLIYRDFTVMGFAAQVSDGELTAEEYAQRLSGADLVFNAVNIVCLAVASVGFAGAARVFRQLIWGEAVFFRNDFITGIKSNGKAFLLIFVLAGAVLWIDNTVGSLQFPVEIVKYIPLGISVVFLLPPALFVLSQTVVYNNSASTSLKNACILYIKSAPVTVLFLVVLILPVFTQFIPLVFVKYGVLLFITLFLLPLYLLAWLLFSFSLFDKFINKENFPELYGRGIYIPEE